MLLARGLSASGRSCGLLRRAGCVARPHASRLRAPARAAAVAEVSSSSAAPAGAAAAAPAGPVAPAPAFKVPLDFRFIRDNVEAVAANCRLRNSTADPALVAQLYDQFAQLKAASDALRSSRNENSAAMKVRSRGRAVRRQALGCWRHAGGRQHGAGCAGSQPAARSVAG